jgi:alkylated DNA repair dioxygenase AlkB
MNLYRDGQDSVGWHADNEPGLGPEPVIASLSLGAVRRFQLKHRTDRTGRVTLDLPHGSCLGRPSCGRRSVTATSVPCAGMT